ncbi:D-alanyl-lipoteichoic acid biosynthesis protein DltB, partial [Lactonifactor longoviformis]
KKYKKSVWYQGVSWIITLQLVMFGFLIFSGRFLELVQGLQ